MRRPLRHRRRSWLLPAALATLLGALALSALMTGSWARAGGQSLSQLNSQLGATQATESNLRSDISALDGQIATLSHQISLVRGREADVRAQLQSDEVHLSQTRGRLAREERTLARLQRALGHARTILSDQLVSEYENPQQSLVAVVLTAGGFRQMLDQLQYLRDAQHSQQRIIAFVTRARAAARTEAHRLSRLRAQQSEMASAAQIQARALAGMNNLLSGRQDALDHIESARRTALANAQARGHRLAATISTIRAEQAAAARAAAAAAARAAAQARAAAAAAAAAASANATPSSSGSSAGVPSAPATATGGWAIPESVVMCESGGQNLPPNSAGASGYYQILPSTWTGEGGSGPAAYLAPKSEQDAIAAKLWNGGAGASNWVCAGIVGIT